MTLHWSGVGVAPLMSLRQNKTSEPLLYAGMMVGPYRYKDATRGRNDDPVTSGIRANSDRGGPKQNRSSCSSKKFLKMLAAQRRSNGLIQMVDDSRCTLDLKSPERSKAKAFEGCRSSVRMTMHEVVHEMVVGECHEPNSEGSGSAWMTYMNARIAGLFMLLLLEYPNGKGVVRATSRGLDMALHCRYHHHHHQASPPSSLPNTASTTNLTHHHRKSPTLPLITTNHQPQPPPPTRPPPMAVVDGIGVWVGLVVAMVGGDGGLVVCSGGGRCDWWFAAVVSRAGGRGGELFGISGKLNVSQMISQDTLIDFYQTVLWICMAIHQRLANWCFSRSYKAVKALYGLKQAPMAWYNELSTFLLQNHFFKCTIDPTLFIRRFHDDIFVSTYVLEILKKYGMESCDPVGTPMEIKDKLDLDQNGTPVDATKYRSMISALIYLTSSRPDIIHATCLCAQYQAKPTEKHLKEVKRIFRYLRGIVNTGLWYSKDSGFELTGFSDADYAKCKDTFKSTSGGAQFLGEKLVSWSSKKQDCTTLSTAEAEYVSLSACCAQVLWMRTQLTDYGFHFNKIPIYCDSKSAIAIFCNPVQHSRTKHIAVRYHFIKEHMENGTIELYFVKTDYQLADLFTKALSADRFNYLVRHLGMRSLSPQELDRLAKSQ
nr:retrovirus-related Pol polyprotein from transposon TNT 1-94 [Tanacetum cinerariifolium]